MSIDRYNNDLMAGAAGFEQDMFTANLDATLSSGPASIGTLTATIFDTEKTVPEVVHNEGCACAECAAFDDDGKDFQPGGGGTFADTIGNTTATTGTLSPGGYVTSDIDTAGDSDWFAITLTAGQTYSFYTILSGSTISDTILTLRNSAGTEISSNDDANITNGLYWSEITFTATTTGTYFLEVAGYSTDIGSYYLTSTAPVADTIAASSSTTASLTMDTPVAGQINANGDHDWYAVTLTAGTTYEFVTSAVNGTDVDTTLMLRGATGTILGYNDDSAGTYSRLVFTATTSGTYFIDVGAWGNAENGAYQITFGEPEPLSLYTNDQIADQLINGYWGGAGQARNFNVAPGGNITVNVTALTAEGQFFALAALNLWSDVMGVTFTEVTTGGNITFDDTQEGAFALSTRSGNTIISSEVNVATAWIANDGTNLNSYSFQTYIHEIGHALGLGHAGNYNGNADYAADALYLNDSWATTVMSYFSQTENTYFAGLGFNQAYITSPMVADAIAMTEMYGTATTTRTGNTTYGNGNTSGRAIYDAVGTTLTSAYMILDHGGTDTLDYSTYTANQRIDLNAETFSNIGGRTGNVTIARGTVIENAIGGTGLDTLIGNSVANTLNGGAGNDTIDGGGGNDILIGGAGTDTMTGGAGNDTFRYLVATDGPTTGLPESITDFAVGSDKIDLIALNVTSHTITNVGNVYTLNAVNGSGTVRIAITTTGGTFTASDILFAAAPPPGVINGTNAGETLDGTANDDTINGLGGNDTINGLDGNDTLNGDGNNDTLNGGNGDDVLNGGIGIDTMVGGAGNDSYTANLTTDVVTEVSNQGTDTVNSSVVWTLANHFENLTLTGGAAVNGTGNSVANVITGNMGANTLAGLGGNDTLIGGAGNDRLIGGAGTDSLTGGAGNDTYQLTDALDSVTELVGEGTDLVQAYVDYTLGDNLENLYLYSTALVGTGNALANKIIGTTGANTLNGMAGADFIYGGSGNDVINGGAGRDQMFGEAGSDLFVFDDGDFGGVTSATADLLRDFSVFDHDTIDLSLVDAITGGADDPFNFIGNTAFTNTAGELRFQTSATTTTVMGDLDGDGVADFWIVLTGVYALDGIDFIL